jgi:formate C-acetyltransferase
MYNKALYEMVLSKSHHVYRKPFDVSASECFDDANMAPVTRMSVRLKNVLAQETPVILDGQRIVFIRTVTDVPNIFTEKEWEEVKAKHFIHELGYQSNLCADYATTISVGLDEKKRIAQEKLADCKANGDEEGALFLEAVLSDIASVYDLCDRYAAKAAELGREDIVEVFRQIPRKGATTFREALQFFRILHYTLWAEGDYHNTIGRFDVFAYPYLEKDMEAGRLSKEQAADLLEEFFLSFNWDNDKYIGVQLGDNGQSMMLGGVDADGNDAYNLLSEMCLETSCELKLIDPKINLRVSKDTPYERYVAGTYLTKAGLGFPQYSNDDIVIPGLVALGYDIKAARNYSVAACWEFITAGCAADIPNIGAVSYPRVLQKAMYESLESAKDFDSFMLEVKKGIQEEVDQIAANIHDLYIIPAPFYSILMDGCLENAKDISLGNKYNNFGLHGTGIATAADSLESIRKHVFEEKTVTAAQMIDAVKNDFAGQEEFLHQCRFETAKIGDNEESVDKIAATLLGWFADSVQGKTNERGGIYRAGTGSAMFYLWHASEIDASADGRRKNEAFGTNFSPSLYVKSKGPFSVIQSFTKCPTMRAINGGPLTMEFHSTVFNTEDGIHQVAQLVKSYVDMGGHQLQLNSINRERMLDAQKHPENYTNMIVRIWGWSAYFVELDREYQNHLIQRQEFSE